ncbi:hypothetical protein EX30DRAFT_374731 [Ascodesmis nigricans]|uniref:BTB domain-containing protein n=1 Tax=Ascodesmis nigricans TaxID=341454 RepID=A0A4S2MPR3_9PEZI|nr:hypothetical protein EX30DRAFT_374731 [Ascodesmis nigricans]
MSADHRIKRPRSESPETPLTSLSRHSLPQRPFSTLPNTDMAILGSLPTPRPSVSGPDFAAIFKSPTVRITLTSQTRAQSSYHLHIDPLLCKSDLLQKHIGTRRPGTVWLAQTCPEFMDDVFPFFIEYVYKSAYELPSDLSLHEKTRALYKISVMGSLLGAPDMRLMALKELAETLREWRVLDDANDVAKVCDIVVTVFRSGTIGLKVGLERDPFAMSSVTSPTQAAFGGPPGRDGRVQGDIGLAIRGLGSSVRERDQREERFMEEQELMEQARWMDKQKTPQRMLVAKWTAGMKTMLWKHDEFRNCLTHGGYFQRYFVENLGDGPGLEKDELAGDLYRKFL